MSVLINQVFFDHRLSSFSKKIVDHFFRGDNVSSLYVALTHLSDKWPLSKMVLSSDTSHRISILTYVPFKSDVFSAKLGIY